MANFTDSKYVGYQVMYVLSIGIVKLTIKVFFKVFHQDEKGIITVVCYSYAGVKLMDSLFSVIFIFKSWLTDKFIDSMFLHQKKIRIKYEAHFEIQVKLIQRKGVENRIR